MEVISVLNSKGGVGKTTTVITLASILALRGIDVLVVDMAPQGNASVFFTDDNDEYNIKKILEEDISDEELAKCIKYVRDDKDIDPLKEHLNIIVSDINLNDTKMKLYQMDQEEGAHRLKKALDRMEEWFDVVIIDNDPTLDILSINSLTASNYVLSPIKPDLFSYKGSQQLVGFMNKIKKEYNPDLGIKGFLPTMCRDRKLDAEIIEQFKAHYDDNLVMNSVIRNRTVAESAVSFTIPIPLLEPESDLVLDYMKTLYELKILDESESGKLAGDILDLEMKINSKKAKQSARRKKKTNG